MNKPEYIKVGNKQYKINTDFRVAIECDRIARDTSIGDLERGLGILYMLFGEAVFENLEDLDKLQELAMKYLNLGKPKEDDNEKPDMDFIQDMDYIEASFMSDYNIDLTNTEMHWWTFYNLISGLSNSELGDCCILNRIRNLRNTDASKIKDNKEREKIVKAQERFALKRNEKPLTEAQKKSQEEILKAVGMR